MSPTLHKKIELLRLSTELLKLQVDILLCEDELAAVQLWAKHEVIRGHISAVSAYVVPDEAAV